MTAPVPLPHSVTDPYAPEPSETKSVVCVLHFADPGRAPAILVTDARACGLHTVIRHAGLIFTHRGDDEIKLDGTRARWCRVYRQVMVVDL